MRGIATGAASVVVLVVAAVIGCGDGSDPDQERAREFRRDGQALCRDALRAAGQPADQTSRERARWLRHVIATSAELVRSLDALEAPARLEPAMREVVDLERRDNAVWRRVVARLARGTSLERAVRPDLEALGRNRTRGDRLYKRLGLTACTSAGADATAI